MAYEQATSATLTSKRSRKNLRWEEKQAEDLINCIISYKTKMTDPGLEFDGDKPRMYKELRESMTEIYQDANMQIFGQVNMTDFNENTISNIDQNKNIETIWKEEKELMIRGRNRSNKKVKDNCQLFSKGVTTRTDQEVERLFMSFLIYW